MKAYLSEYLGTTFLLMIVVGSGIMGQSLSDNDSITLLANTIATGAGLIVLIWMFGKISGAHFNPAVSVVMFANFAPKSFESLTNFAKFLRLGQCKRMHIL